MEKSSYLGEEQIVRTSEPVLRLWVQEQASSKSGILCLEPCRETYGPAEGFGIMASISLDTCVEEDGHS